ncbi:MAG: 5-formyltetrahydrofolate cyclo-ligase [Firmicutes bacterium]|nr:5-formyltetrahydrofolate cyclo-ligase [Bacillota bacterium]
MDSLRKSKLSERAKMDALKRAESDKAIFENVKELDAFKNAESIYTYINTDTEAETKTLINYALDTGKRVFVPVTLKERIYFTEIKSLEGLKKTKMGIYEPESTEEKEPAEGDMFIIPGSVFDKKGHRYGYGAGYYDRFLSKCAPVLKIALCYDFQLLESIETSEHDIDMDIIITDKRIVFV